jgi:putative transposase
VKHQFIQRHAGKLSINRLCQMVGLSRSSYYAWAKRPAKLISAEELQLYRRAKALFAASRQSLGSRELMKKLREEGFMIGRYRTQTVMRKLGLRPTQRVTYKVTTRRKHSDRVADNLLNQIFNPMGLNQVWAGDITYLKTGEGWMYLAVVMDLYSRRIDGWDVSKSMTTDLIERALMKAIRTRRPKRGLVFHSDRGSQYTSSRFRSLLSKHGLRSSMGDVGACWDNAVVERFFGSLKHDWILKVHQPTRMHMKEDVAAYMRYYNVDRLHSANDDMSPMKFELSELNVSSWT